MINLEYTQSEKEKSFWVVVGMIVGILIFPWKYFYTFFFEREQYFTRKNLLKYLQNNPLPPFVEPEGYPGSYCWTIDHYRLYLWKGDPISLHRTEDSECVLCSFYSKGIDEKRTKKIEDLLKKEISKLKTK
jgi:hypothetical protein